jgi:hypothetical protein
MIWTTSSTDLRSIISDGPLDKYNFRKTVFGTLNGTNKSFKTLEQRRVTDLTTATAPLGVFVNDVAATVTSDNPIEGEFTLTTAPNNGDKIEVSYYNQWFLDAEIFVFLQTATQWCLGVDDVTSVASGLRPSVLHYAAGEAYKRLSLFFARTMSATYKSEDQSGPALHPQAKIYFDSAVAEVKLAETLRAQFYTRNDQYKAPLFRTLSGRVPSTQPKR